ncbi:MAG: hypothetical protein WCO98_15650 [bacterium]
MANDKWQMANCKFKIKNAKLKITGLSPFYEYRRGNPLWLPGIT